MAGFVKLDPSKLEPLRRTDERSVCYHVELAQVAAGTFQIADVKAQGDGEAPSHCVTGPLRQRCGPVHKKVSRLIRLTKELEPGWVRVSDSGDGRICYDFDGHTGGMVPEGFQGLLTKDRWLSFLDFVKAVDGKLMVSIPGCPDLPADDESAVAQLLRTSREYGVPASAAQMAEGAGDSTRLSGQMGMAQFLRALGTSCTVTDGAVFCDVLGPADGGLLERDTFEPLPNYFASLLWTRLMGSVVYDASASVREGVQVYCHSRRDGKPGYVYLLITDPQQTTFVDLPAEAVRYTLTGERGSRSCGALLNGRRLELGYGDRLPELRGAYQEAGTMKLAQGSCTFLVF